MAKKGKKNSKRSSQAIVHREAYQRLNFLYQAAILSLSHATPYNIKLSRLYVRTMKTISEKLVLRLDPTIKRLICKSCDSLLLPGLTCTHRHNGHRERHVTVTCLSCGGNKRFLARKNFQLHSQNSKHTILF